MKISTSLVILGPAVLIGAAAVLAFTNGNGGGTPTSAQEPYRAINPQVARDNPDPATVTPTPAATSSSSASATSSTLQKC